MTNSQRTIYGMDLALHQSFGLKYNFKQGTTLNNFLDILSKDPYPTNIYPTINYFCIGTGGDTRIEGTQYPFSQHQAKDAGLFHMVPFIAKRASEDLEEAERKKYRLRKIMNVDGESYVFYFLKVIGEENIDLNSDYTQFNHSETQEEIMQQIDFTNNPSILRPTPVNKVDLIASSSTSYITKLLVVKLKLSYQDLINVREAIELFSRTEFGKEDNPNYIITEIGLCHGVDTVITDGKNIIESLGTQINMHLGMTLELTMFLNDNMDSKQGISKSISLGGMEPLYVR